MNSLNPWVALTEILLLLGVAFSIGWGIAWLQYRRRIRAQQQSILKLQNELKPYNPVGRD